MIDWPVKCRGGWRWALRSAQILCGGLCTAPVSNVAAMAPPYGHTESAAPTLPGDRDSTGYEAYVLARGGVLLASTHLTLTAHKRLVIPAFARKYGLACSACHTAWPELNSFGQRFKDNGYQLGNDRDSPIWVNPSYIPFAVRTTPQWRLERTTHQPVDAVPGDPTSGTEERTITQSGFDISGADLLMLGTLYKDITFGFVPTVADGEGVGIEAAFVRFDNLAKSPWVNLKFGKFELDNMLSEKRSVMLSSNGTFYQTLPLCAGGRRDRLRIGG